MSIYDLNTGLLIRSKYLGATDFNGTRIKSSIVRDKDFHISTTCHWDYSLDHADNYLKSAKTVLEKWNHYRKQSTNLKDHKINSEIPDMEIHTYSYDAKNGDYIFLCSEKKEKVQ